MAEISLSEAFARIMKEPEGVLANSELTAEQLRQLQDRVHKEAMVATERELEGDEPTAAGANWYFDHYKEPQLDDERRIALSDLGRHLRKTGLVMLYNSIPSTLGTETVKKIGRNQFRIKESGSSNKKLRSQTTIPDEFSFS